MAASGDETNAVLVCELPILAVDRDGVEYRVRAWAQLDARGQWEGVLELVAPGGEILRTGTETTQVSREAVASWAAGLGAFFLQGALERAKRRAGWKPPVEEVVIREGPIVAAPDGRRYRAEVHAHWDAPSSWAAWIVFRSLGGSAVLRTGRETSQPSLAAVSYWAEGLEPLYFEGALLRAGD